MEREEKRTNNNIQVALVHFELAQIFDIETQKKHTDNGYYYPRPAVPVDLFAKKRRNNRHDYDIQRTKETRIPDRRVFNADLLKSACQCQTYSANKPAEEQILLTRLIRTAEQRHFFTFDFIRNQDDGNKTNRAQKET